mgnify:CR=1 FL=1
MSAENTTPDYRNTVFLPETEFPMRAGLPQREPDWLARWERIGVYDRLRDKKAADGGKRADFTAFDIDLMTVPEAEIPKGKAVLTVVDGVVVFEAEPAG